ncbi:MAG: permease, partial [Comamonadaceae bacterium]
MIARWQRALILFILVAMAAWLIWQWPRSPQVAIVGALVPLGLYLLVMAVEFVLMHIT